MNKKIPTTLTFLILNTACGRRKRRIDQMFNWGCREVVPTGEYFRGCMDLNLDQVSSIHPSAVSSGYALACPARKTGEEKYRPKADCVFEDDKNIARVPNFGISHRDQTIEYISAG